jgi:hypothetical protein
MDVVLLGLRLALTATLYAFLGAVIYFLWQDLRNRAKQATPAPCPYAELVAVKTTADALEVGARFQLQAVNSIGRSPISSVVVPDAYASAQHALLSWREGQWMLEDQGSHNGTLVNGTRIRELTIITPGDIISVGHTELRLEPQ